MFGTDTFTIVRQGRDENGDPTGSTAETDSTGWYVQPRGAGTAPSSRENTERGLTVTDDWWAIGPPDADIRAGDRVRWNSELFEVDGDPARWGPPGGPPHHLQVILRRVRG